MIGSFKKIPQRIMLLLENLIVNTQRAYLRCPFQNSSYGGFGIAAFLKETRYANFKERKTHCVGTDTCLVDSVYLLNLSYIKFVSSFSLRVNFFYTA